MAELDRFIRMIPGFLKKKVHVDLNKLAQAFMPVDSNVSGIKKETGEEVAGGVASKHPVGEHPQDETSGGGGPQ